MNRYVLFSRTSHLSCFFTIGTAVSPGVYNVAEGLVLFSALFCLPGLSGFKRVNPNPKKRYLEASGGLAIGGDLAFSWSCDQPWVIFLSRETTADIQKNGTCVALHIYKVICFQFISSHKDTLKISESPSIRTWKGLAPFLYDDTYVRMLFRFYFPMLKFGNARIVSLEYFLEKIWTDTSTQAVWMAFSREYHLSHFGTLLPPHKMAACSTARCPYLG